MAELVAAVRFYIFIGFDNQLFEDAHYLEMICIRYFNIDRCCLVQVLGRVVFLSPENWPDFIDLFKSCGHHHLFIELRALVEECLFVKVGNGEQLRSRPLLRLPLSWGW